MLDRVPDVQATMLDLESYLTDFRHEFARTTSEFFKLERQQTFREPGDPSWEAFNSGDWSRALELNELDRPTAQEMTRRHQEQGVDARRIRIVESPVSSYVQWEMHFLRFLAEEGQPLRVLRAAQVKEWETVQALPELVLLGGRVLYQVRYDTAGAPCGARRVDDRDVITACRDDLVELFAQGEPLLDYFHREIVPLPPPAV